MSFSVKQRYFAVKLRVVYWLMSNLLTHHQSYSVTHTTSSLCVSMQERTGALGHVGHSEGRGVSAAGVLHPNDEVIGSPGALHQ